MSPDAPTTPLTTRVEFETATSKPPLLVAVKDGDGPWTGLPVEADETYETFVTGSYAIAVVCGDATGYATEIHLASPRDESPRVLCFAGGGGTTTTVELTGEMAQPGTVAMLDQASGTTSPWSFALDVPTGTRDLFAWNDARILIRRDIEVTAPAQLAAVDLAQGAAFNLVPVIVSNARADETLRSELTLITEGGIADLVFGDTTLRRVPPTLLTGMFDFQLTEISASTATTVRTVDYDGSQSTTLELMAHVEGAVLEDAGVSWTSAPAGHETWYSVGTSSPRRELRVTASARYLGGQTSLAFDLAIPGYDAAWGLGSGPRARLLTVVDDGFARTVRVRRND